MDNSYEDSLKLYPVSGFPQATCLFHKTKNLSQIDLDFFEVRALTNPE